MSDQKFVVLPDADEIMRRLTTVSDDKLQRQIYARVARHAGTEKVGEGIVMLFLLAFYEVVPGGISSAVLWTLVPNWIDALVDDKQVVEEAKAFYSEGDKSGLTSRPEETSRISPPIKDPFQAQTYLEQWIRDQGWTEKVRVMTSYGKRGDVFDFDVIEPYGVFLVYEDGRVVDNYGVFTKNQT